MIFNMIGGGGLAWRQGSMEKSGTSGTFGFPDLGGKPKVFIIHKITTSATNGFLGYAILQEDGTYVGQSVSGDTNMQTRNKSSDAAWDEATHTFTIKLWASNGTYLYDYIL